MPHIDTPLGSLSDTLSLLLGKAEGSDSTAPTKATAKPSRKVPIAKQKKRPPQPAIGREFSISVPLDPLGLLVARDAFNDGFAALAKKYAVSFGEWCVTTEAEGETGEMITATAQVVKRR